MPKKYNTELPHKNFGETMKNFVTALKIKGWNIKKSLKDGNSVQTMFLKLKKIQPKEIGML